MPEIHFNLHRIWFIFLLTGSNFLSASAQNDTRNNLEEDMPAFGAVIISEFITDPTPTFGLPEAEYIELYNASSASIATKELFLSVDQDTIWLPEGVLLPGEYLVVCRCRDAELFSGGIAIACVERFYNLRKESGNLILGHKRAGLLHYVGYNIDWFEDIDKSEGGWSLEIIDLSNTCLQKENWAVSTNISGGTPGKANSVAGSITDNYTPFLEWVAFFSDTSLLLKFSEGLMPLTTLNRMHYSINEGTFPVRNASIYQGSPSFILLQAGRTFLPDELYRLSLSGLMDCSSNKLYAPLPVLFSVSETPEYADVVINEVMYEPDRGMPEYVELMNRSQKFLSASELMLSREFSGDDSAGFIPLSSYAICIPPGEFVVLSKDDSWFYCSAQHSKGSLSIAPENFPPLTNTGSSLFLTSKKTRIIDEIRYDGFLHSPFLSESRGVSLEKIHPDSLGLNPQSWSSASALAEYSTPGKTNSQLVTNSNQPQIHLSSDVISPNGDRFRDELIITTEFGRAGRMVTLNIFNASGFYQGSILNNVLCGPSEKITWDGRLNGQMLGSGIYILYFETFTPKGEVWNYKTTLVLAR